MAHDVFISYSHKDKPIADAICTNLETAGVRCWIAPRDIGPGEDWPTAIAREIPQSRVMVMIFSSNSNTSDQVYRELFLAANNNVIIIPFKIEDVKPNPRTGYILAGTHWLDAMNPPTQEQIDKLVKSVKSFLSNPDVIKPVQVKPHPPGSSNLKTARRIPIWVWRILIAVIILAAIVMSVFVWEQAHKTIPLISQVSSPRNTPVIPITSPVLSITDAPETSAAPASGPQSERARTFAGPILTLVAQRKPDFEEDFKKINPDWMMKVTGDLSAYAIEEGVARFWVNQDNSSMSNEKAFTGKDFVLQLDTRLVSGDTTSWIGIDIHAGPSMHGFYTSLHPAAQEWFSSGRWGGDNYNYASGTDKALIPGGKPVQITIIVRGSRYALYLDQTPMSFFEDSNLDNPGATYFHCESVSPAVCEFDNVKYWNLANIPGLP